jgi:hypothetical protein
MRNHVMRNHSREIRIEGKCGIQRSQENRFEGKCDEKPHHMISQSCDEKYRFEGKCDEKSIWNDDSAIQNVEFKDPRKTDSRENGQRGLDFHLDSRALQRALSERVHQKA